MRKIVSFDEFNKDWNHPNGYIPVYVYGDEDFRKEGYVRMVLDMVYPSRLLDGKIAVLTVEMTKEQLPEFHKYLAMIGDHWKRSIQRPESDLLEFTNNFQP